MSDNDDNKKPELPRTTGKKGRRGKTLEEHIRDGTFQYSKHKHLLEEKAAKEITGEEIAVRPEMLPKDKCGDPRRWIRDWAAGSDEAAIAEGCYFDEAQAAFVVEWFERYLQHSKGEFEGKPFTLLDWQRDDIIYPLFGWITPEGKRRFKTTYIQIPKKNGKSTLASGIGLFLLCGDNEPGAEIYSCATDKDQASIVHGEAVNMVQSSDVLDAHCNINLTNRNITYRRSKYVALSARPSGKEGLNASGLIIDELHVWDGTLTWDALKYAGTNRRNPLRFVITTAGDDIESVCYKQYEYGKEVNKGTVIDQRHFVYVREIDVETSAEEGGDDYKSRDAMYKANPSMGYTMSEEDFRADLQEAERNPETLATFMRYRLDVWKQTAGAAMNPADWDACCDAYGEGDLAGRECYGGLDLSQTTDMTAFVLCFPFTDDLVKLLAWFWLPRDGVRKMKNEDEAMLWVQQGWLNLTEGNVIDYSSVEAEIGRLSQLFKIQAIGYDKTYAERSTQEIEDVYGVPRIVFPQTMMHFAGPTKDFLTRVKGGKLRHNGSPVLTRQANHVTVRTDANGNMRPVKPKHGDPRKIDGIVSAIMSLGIKDAAPPQHEESVYARRGIIAA